MAYQEDSFGRVPSSVTDAVVRNRVLRNTYVLLAISMIPTVIGAWLGVAMGFSFFAGSPFIGLIVFLAVAFGFFYAIERFKDSGVGVLLLLGFTFFMGLMLSRLIGNILGLTNGAHLIMTAFGGTAAIFAVMASVATFSKRDFSGLGKWLFVGFLVILVAAIANIWLQMPALTLTISALAVLFFFLADRLHPRFARAFGSRAELADPVGLPVLLFIVTVFGLLAQPVMNTLSRMEETESDMYSLKTVGLPDALASALVKTAEYRDPRPGALQEILFYTHPSVEQWVRRAMEWKAAQAVRGPVVQ